MPVSDGVLALGVRLLPARPRFGRQLRLGSRPVRLFPRVRGELEELVGAVLAPVVLPVAAPRHPLP
ncbi:hypothetical protein [Streptomyces sp. NPDC048411]|uniref:hypothetical protein n=1 Tax=Streptomyces sp. NPDC048411 TaxID=3157206 RepID=UPI003456346F